MDLLRDEINSESKDESDFSSAQYRFFGDSPYYNAFVEKEMYSAEVLSVALEDIGTEVETFSKASATLVKSMHSLSFSFRKHGTRGNQNIEEPRVELGPEMGMLQDFGETLEELAEAHQSMHERIESCLGYHLMELAAKQVNVVNSLKKEKKEAEAQTKLSEQRFFQYLNGKSAGGNFDNSTDTGNKRAPKLQRSSSSDGDDFTHKCTSQQSRRKRSKSIERPILRQTPRRRRSIDFCWPLIRDSLTVDSELDVAGIDTPRRGSSGELVGWKSSLEQIRLSETAAEFHRFQLCKNIVDAGYERRFELGRNTTEILRAMRNCFQRCSEKLSQSLSTEFQNQEKCVDSRRRTKPLWETRETLLRRDLTKLKRTGTLTVLSGEVGEDLDISDIERDVDIWDLPNKLAAISQFRRPSPRDVLMEGWLYEQSRPSGMMPLKSSWIRRWFILKHDEIFYLESSVSEGSHKHLSTRTKKKLFDVILCSVRELLDEPSARFCFQLIDSSNKSVTLQARGPKELQLWLNCIRSAVESQLQKSVELKPDPKMELRKESSEKNTTVLKAGSSTSWNLLTTILPDGKSESSSSIKKDTDVRVGNINNPLIMQVLKANKKCADCGTDSPDWASLNLGILVCLECSGVHRSLGCHISKVRSLTLDRLAEAEVSLLLLLGNKRMNEIWERDMEAENKSLKKLACIEDQMAREEFIKSKYVKKEFLGVSYDMDDKLVEEEVSHALCSAANTGNVIGIATALARGANVDWKMSDDEGGICTALSISTMRRDKKEDFALECVELLLQNGAKVGP